MAGYNCHRCGVQRKPTDNVVCSNCGYDPMTTGIIDNKLDPYLGPFDIRVDSGPKYGRLAEISLSDDAEEDSDEYDLEEYFDDVMSSTLQGVTSNPSVLTSTSSGDDRQNAVDMALDIANRYAETRLKRRKMKELLLGENRE